MNTKAQNLNRTQWEALTIGMFKLNTFWKFFFPLPLLFIVALVEINHLKVQHLVGVSHIGVDISEIHILIDILVKAFENEEQNQYGKYNNGEGSN